LINKFDGVSLWSSDLQNLLPFYRDTLGFEVMLDSPRFVIFGGAGGGLCIGSHSEVHGRPQDPHRWLLRVESDDLEADVARLRAAGVEIVQEPSAEQDGLWLATVKDPEGNLIQLNYWEPGRRPEGR
jgi:predicted enzyme related to lactoylglutathione lyase